VEKQPRAALTGELESAMALFQGSGEVVRFDHRGRMRCMGTRGGGARDSL
jgi:hypothetical protein